MGECLLIRSGVPRAPACRWLIDLVREAEPDQHRAVITPGNLAELEILGGNRVRRKDVVDLRPEPVGHPGRPGSQQALPSLSRRVGTARDGIPQHRVIKCRVEVARDDRPRTARAEPPQLAEVRTPLCDIAKARRILGWAPQVTLEEGLARTIRYFRAELSLATPLELTPAIGGQAERRWAANRLPARLPVAASGTD